MNRIYVMNDNLTVHDLTPEIIPFLREIDPSYEVSSVLPENGYVPRFQFSRRSLISVREEDFNEIALSELQDIHSEPEKAANSYIPAKKNKCIPY